MTAKDSRMHSAMGRLCKGLASKQACQHGLDVAACNEVTTGISRRRRSRWRRSLISGQEIHLVNAIQVCGCAQRDDFCRLCEHRVRDDPGGQGDEEEGDNEDGLGQDPLGPHQACHGQLEQEERQ